MRVERHSRAIPAVNSRSGVRSAINCLLVHQAMLAEIQVLDSRCLTHMNILIEYGGVLNEDVILHNKNMIIAIFKQMPECNVFTCTHPEWNCILNEINNLKAVRRAIVNHYKIIDHMHGHSRETTLKILRPLVGDDRQSNFAAHNLILSKH